MTTKATIIAIGIAANLSLLCKAAAGQDRGPAAIVVTMSGAPALIRASTRLALPVGARLHAGDSLDIAAGSAVRLLHRTGRLENVTTSMKIADADGRPDAGLFSRAVNTLASVAAAEPAAVLNREGMIRPIPGSAVAISPRNGVTIADTLPLFTWFAVPGAKAYTLQLRAAGGRPIRFQTGGDTVWTATVPLRRGIEYEWTVSARPAGRPAGVQTFRVADDGEFSAAAAALTDAAASDAPDDLFLAALTLHHAGFLYEARSALERLHRTGAVVDPAVHLLHAHVLAALGDQAAASAAFRRAAGERP